MILIVLGNSAVARCVEFASFVENNFAGFRELSVRNCHKNTVDMTVSR